MCSVDHRALVRALVKPIAGGQQKCSSNTGSSKHKSEESLNEASQHEAEEQLAQDRQQ